MSLSRGALAAIALSCAACTPPDSRTARDAFLPNTSTIFPADSPSERLLVCQGDPPYDDRWTPTQQEIDRFEPVLIKLLEYRLAEIALTRDVSTLAPPEYHRHYFGLATEGRRFILVCGLHGEELVYMHDGGPSRFTAVYDPQRQHFTWFEFGYL